MKTIKTLLLAGMTVFMLTVPTSCTDYQDEIDALDVRVTYLENLVNQVNTNLGSLSKIVNALNEGDYIRSVESIPGGGGYQITFVKGGTVTIKDGEKGDEPNISIAQYPVGTGEWYWTLNGEFIEVNGTKVRANGKDGMQPLVNIRDNHWVYSLDGGNSWIPVPGGETVKGKDGEPGSKVVTGFSIDGNDPTNAKLILTLANGTQVLIPIVSIIS